MQPHRLTNFEIQKCYQNEPKFNGVHSRNNLLKINDEAYVINLDEFTLRGTHWIASYVNVNNIVYFDSFGVEHIPKEIKKFIRNKNSITNIYRKQACDSVVWGYCLLDNTNLFSPNEYGKNDKILKYFQ